MAFRFRRKSNILCFLVVVLVFCLSNVLANTKSTGLIYAEFSKVEIEDELQVPDNNLDIWAYATVMAAY